MRLESSREVQSSQAAVQLQCDPTAAWRRTMSSYACRWNSTPAMRMSYCRPSVDTRSQHHSAPLLVSPAAAAAHSVSLTPRQSIATFRTTPNFLRAVSFTLIITGIHPVALLHFEEFTSAADSETGHFGGRATEWLIPTACTRPESHPRLATAVFLLNAKCNISSRNKRITAFILFFWLRLPFPKLSNNLIVQSSPTDEPDRIRLCVGHFRIPLPSSPHKFLLSPIDRSHWQRYSDQLTPTAHLALDFTLLIDSYIRDIHNK